MWVPVTRGADAGFQWQTPAMGGVRPPRPSSWTSGIFSTYPSRPPRARLGTPASPLPLTRPSENISYCYLGVGSLWKVCRNLLTHCLAGAGEGAGRNKGPSMHGGAPCFPGSCRWSRDLRLLPKQTSESLAFPWVLSGENRLAVPTSTSRFGRERKTVGERGPHGNTRKHLP